MIPANVLALATLVSVVFSAGCVLGALLFRQGMRDEARRIRDKAQALPVRVVPQAPDDRSCMNQQGIEDLISRLALLIAGENPPSSSAEDLARHAVCLLQDQKEASTANALAKEFQLLGVDPRFGGVDYGHRSDDPANDEQRPVEVRAFCLPCKAPGLIVVSKLPGTTSYEIRVPDGWLLGHEPRRFPLTVFLVCPTCEPEYKGLVPRI